MQPIIKEILAEETHCVRHPILRQGRPIEDCIFTADQEATTVHLGAYLDDKLVGVLSAYKKNHLAFNNLKSYQIRGVAVLTDFHRKGIGKELMDDIEKRMMEIKIDLIWLNARIAALDFYTSLAYHQKGEAFEIDDIGTHYCFYKLLK